MITKEKLINELKNKQYRDAFVSAHVDIGIPHQIRILREQRGWTQQDLADRTGGKQAWIARIENPNYTGVSLKTLKKLASAFDIAVIVRFVPISNLVKWELEISPEKLEAVTFDKDPYYKERPQTERAMLYIVKPSNSPNISRLGHPERPQIQQSHMGQQEPKRQSSLLRSMAGGAK